MTATCLVNGDVVTLSNVFKVSGTATDPTTISLAVTDPGGTTTTYTYGAATITRSSAGSFTKDITATSVGIWQYVWTGTGTAADVADGTFTINTVADRTLYCSVEELKSYLGSPAAGVNYDTALRMVADSASRSVDGYCNRSFWIDATVTPRRYSPKYLTRIDFDDDLGSTTGLIIATDASGDGTFETTWAASDFELLPVNAPYGIPEPQPYTSMQAVGGKTLPWLVNTWLTRYDRVQITGLWGWPSIPAAVRQATLIKAAALFHRRNSPQGIAAFDEFGPVRLGRGEDTDVVRLLEPYRKNPVLVA